MALKVQNAVINKINTVPFYLIIFDTTQDISTIDQMYEFYRYCMVERGDNGIPKALVIKKILLGFNEVEDQTALAIFKKNYN